MSCDRVMDVPVNAAYGKNDKPAEQPHSMVLFGYFIPGESVWKVGVIIGAGLLVAFMMIMVFLPSGLPFLAAKNAGGFLDYVGLFFLYMLSFFVFIAVVVGVFVGITTAVKKQQG